ncbi:MAG TPA: alpha/beta hydrolase, partial [Deinococcales bacterium]|nr:alpha/beta hydrolase [Deinococcales bacterium]
LLLHGGGVAGWMWEPLVWTLQPGRRLFVPDLPGHGRSADRPYVSHAETVRELAALLRTGGNRQPAAVIGFSLGAQLAVLLAARWPELVSEAVIVSAQAQPLRLNRAVLSLLGLTAPLARRRWFARLQAKELSIPAAMLEDYIATSAGITRETLLSSVSENFGFELPEEWKQFPGRALVMAGARERKLMRDSAVTIHRALPGSELEIVEGCGHGIPLQKPAWFSERLADWLKAA